MNSTPSSSLHGHFDTIAVVSGFSGCSRGVFILSCRPPSRVAPSAFHTFDAERNGRIGSAKHSKLVHS